MTATTTKPKPKPKRPRRGSWIQFFLDHLIGALLWIWFTLTWPFWAAQVGVVWIATTIGQWWSSRNFWLLLAGLPAVLAIVFSGYLILAIALQDPRQLVEKYRKAAKNCMDTGKFDAAKVYLERVLEFQRGDREALFDLAKAAASTDDSPRAASAMLVLAPTDHAVYGPAHLWQATRLLSHKPLTIKELRVAELHLGYALQMNENNPVAHRLLAEIYFQQGLWTQAIPHLKISLQHDRDCLLKLAVAYQRLGDKDKARRFGEEARDDFIKRSASRPQDTQLKVSLAEVYVFLERFADAIQSLRDSLVLDEKPELHQALARVYIAWSDSLTGDSQEIRQQKFSLLAAGIQENPDELMLFDRVMRLVESNPNDEDAVQSFLNANLLEGRAIGLSHLLLGSLELKREKHDEAMLHLERAYEVMPDAGIVANNLAWLLIHATPSQAERALPIIESCIRRVPQADRFRDTRGHALLKLKRYREAVNDLEGTLQMFRNTPRNHLALAEAYEQLGLKELATQHLSRAQELKDLDAKASARTQK